MIKKLRAVENTLPKHGKTKVHPQILDILFENRRHIKNVFLEIHGLYNVEHMGITLINPENEIITFSTTPNIEYNLINQGLWREDPCFSSPDHENNAFIWWDVNKNSYRAKKIERIKVHNNGFSLGFTIARQINNFCLLYSYATRATSPDLREYYSSNLSGLINIGDYFLKSIQSIYATSGLNYKFPELNNLTAKKLCKRTKSHLKLLTNS